MTSQVAECSRGRGWIQRVNGCHWGHSFSFISQVCFSSWQLFLFFYFQLFSWFTHLINNIELNIFVINMMISVLTRNLNLLKYIVITNLFGFICIIFFFALLFCFSYFYFSSSCLIEWSFFPFLFFCYYFVAYILFSGFS